MFHVIGLGNPGAKYEHTRHNIGRDIVDEFRGKHGFSDWKFDKKKNALISEGGFKDMPVTLVLPETFMNDSGQAVRHFVKDPEAIAQCIVVYDELDLALGKMKISFDKNSGGHKGAQSIIDHIKSKAFPRLRVGIAPVDGDGVMQKVLGEDEVIKHVLSQFALMEMSVLKEVVKHGVTAIELMIEWGHDKAANEVNGWKIDPVNL